MFVWTPSPSQGSARFLVGRLSVTGPPLEEEPELAGPGAPPLVLAPDDEGRLARLLAEAGDRESTDPGEGRLIPLEGAQLEAAQAFLADVPLRPWRVPVEQTSVCAIAPLSDPALKLMPIHRAISGVSTFTADRFLTLVREYAQIHPLPESLETAIGLRIARERMAALAEGHHVVLLVLPEGGKILTFRQGLELDHVRAAPRSTTLRSLDLALLNALVLRTVVGLDHPERRAHSQVSHVETLKTLVEGVSSGRFQAGFGMNPPPAWEIRAVIEAAQQLPAATLRVQSAPSALPGA